MQAIEERVPGDVSAAAFWLVAGADPSRRRARHPRRRRQPDPARRHRHPALDGRRHRGAAARSPPRRRRRRADRRPARALVDAPRPSSSARPTWPPPSTRSRSCAWRRPWRPARPSSGAPASSATRSRTGSRGSAAGLRALGARIEIDGDDLHIDGGAGAARRRNRQPRRPSTGDDVRDRRPRRHRPDLDRPTGLGGGLLSRLLRRPRKGASMTKRVVLIGHPVAHSLSGAMQQAAFDAARHRRALRAVGSQPDGAGRRRRRAARPTTSWAPTSRSRTRNGSCRWSTA